MTITEAARHDLLVALEGAIGKEAAMTLAAHLPPVGWADVATTRDLEHLETRLDASLHRELGVIHRELGLVHQRMGDRQRLLFFAILGAAVANAAIVLAAVRMLAT